MLRRLAKKPSKWRKPPGGLQKRLEKLPSGGQLVHPAITVTVAAFEVIVGIFFTFAAAAVDVIVRGKDPAKEAVPAVLFPARDAEG